MKRLAIYAFALILTPLASTSWASHAKKHHGHVRHIRVQPFTGLSISGGVNVTLLYRPSKMPSVQKAGPGSQAIRINVKNRILSIKAPSRKLNRQLPNLVISLSKPLNFLSIEGIANLSAHGIKAYRLTIHDNGPGYVALSGQLNTQEIRQTSGGYLQLQGVQGNLLALELSKLATTDLRGSINQLNARLAGASTLKAEGLRARTIFVRTENNAVAHVFPLMHLYATAHNHSQVFYYHAPRSKIEDAQQSSHILQLGWGR